MTDVREMWRRSHGYSEEDIEVFVSELDWLLDDPRFRGPDFEPPEVLGFFWQYAQGLEQEIIRLMSAGSPYVSEVESLDGAFLLSQIHALFPPRWVEFFTRLGMPDSLLTADPVQEWQPLIDEGIALSNGNLFSNHPWSLSDPAWTLLTPSYAALCLDPTVKAEFGTTPARIEITDTDVLSLALIGDWGSGSFDDGEGQLCPADAVMEQVGKLDVDYTFHLGDVYPVGQRPFYDNFLEKWKSGRRGSFNLNSNHDMYGWGSGFFDQAMHHPTFALQQHTSYFSVEFGEWIIIGLDAAYFDDSPLLFAGGVNDEHQKAFLREIRDHVERTGKKTLVMTHYTGLNLEGTETTNIWDDVVAEDALGKPPDVWYWGHAHDGVIYSNSSAAGPGTMARCVGHGSIPIAPPIGLEQHTGPGKSIDGYAHTPYDDDIAEHRGRIMNGFATVTLTRDGGITERFINQDGTEWYR